MRYLLLLLGTFLLSSCIYIASTKTSYNHNITDEAKKRIVFVGQNDSFRLTTNENSNGSFHKPTKQLYLVSGKQMKATLARGTWQIVYVCLPYCKASACVSYKTFCDSARNRGVQPWVVLRDIWCDSIVNSVEKYPLVEWITSTTKRLYAVSYSFVIWLMKPRIGRNYTMATTFSFSLTGVRLWHLVMNFLVCWNFKVC